MFLPIRAKSTDGEFVRHLVPIEDIRLIVEAVQVDTGVKTIICRKKHSDLLCAEDFDTLSNQLASQYMLLALPQVTEKRKNEADSP